jgi:hypothetical protein
MPADTSATEFQSESIHRNRVQPGLPSGAGILIAMTVGAAIWAGILALFLI